MDQSTHEIRRDYWFDIVTRCSQRPDGCTVRQWLAESGIKEKAYYYWLRKFRKEALTEFKTELPVVSKREQITFAEIPVGTTGLKAPATEEFSFKPDAVIRIKSSIPMCRLTVAIIIKSANQQQHLLFRQRALQRDYLILITNCIKNVA